MKSRHILIASICFLAGLVPTTVFGQKDGDFVIEKKAVSRPSDNLMQVDMTIDLGSIKVGTSMTKVLDVAICGASDTLYLPSVAVYGRQRWIQSQRHEFRAEGKDGYGFPAASCPNSFEYSQLVPWQSWMTDVDVLIFGRELGCCNCPSGSSSLLASTEFHQRFPRTCALLSELEFIAPEPEKGGKIRSVSGKAYIDFPVNVATINPDYRNNAVELGKIIASIDSVKNDPDIKVDSISIKGFASPEGNYDLNRQLAMGRTRALADYVKTLKDFPQSIFTISWEPENWAGLRAYVADSQLADKQAILNIIDIDMDVDAKERKIKTTYPEQYRILLDDCYPALRVSDYRILYTIREYTEIRDIERIMEEKPQNLSLEELYRLAQVYDPDSREFRNVLTMSAYMYPESPVANLNAANVALLAGDLDSAEEFLSKAGASPQAEQARAVLIALREQTLF